MSRFQSYLVSTLLVIILSDFHSEGAHTIAPFPANDESSKPDTKHSLKVCQVADIALQMSTNKARPFPPPSASTGTVYPMQSAIGTPAQYSIGPAPGFTCPPESTFAQNFLYTFPDTPDLSPQSFPVHSSRSTANFLPHSTVPPRRPTAHDPPHQPTQVPAPTYPTYQAPRSPRPSTSTGTVYTMQSTIGTLSQYSIGPAPGFTYPPESTFAQNFLCTFPDTPDLSPQSFLVHNSRSTANFLPHSTVPPRRPSAHDPPHQPLQVPVHTYPAVQMPQAQDTCMPISASSPPPGMMQTMQMPDPRNNDRLSPGPYSNYSPQAQGMSQSISQRREGMLGAAQNAPIVYRNRTSVPSAIVYTLLVIACSI